MADVLVPWWGTLGGPPAAILYQLGQNIFNSIRECWLNPIRECCLGAASASSVFNCFQFNLNTVRIKNREVYTAAVRTEARHRRDFP